MNDFDRMIKTMAAQENTEVPASVKNRVEETLSQLPERETVKKTVRMVPRAIRIAACIALAALIIPANLSVTCAHALEQIPVLGSLVRVVTVRNYFYSDGRHEADVKVPELEGSGQGADAINQDVSKLTTALMDEFYKNLELANGSGYGSIHVDYETVTNTDRWFTLKLSVTEIAASSDQYYQFYHMDKAKGQIVKLGDLFSDASALEVLTQEIKTQMQQQMERDESVTYWMDSEIDEDFVTVGPERNFYWTEQGELVIVFDKYEVAPGSMGAPEFVIPRDVFQKLLKQEYASMKFG